MASTKLIKLKIKFDGGNFMSRDFYLLNEEARKVYEETINQMLQTIADNEKFTQTIRNLCNQALENNWTLDKKVNIINIIH